MYQINPLNHTMIFNNYSTGSAPGEDMGKDEFLLMLVTQLRNQDPMSPMESQEFASQLAEFRSLESLESIDSSVSEGVDVDLVLTQAINNTLATTLIGKNVMAYGNSIQLSSGADADLNFRLGHAAENVDINVYDAQGNLIRTMTAKSMSAGDQVLTWDGENDQGEKVPDGIYTFEVNATDVNGNSIDAYAITRGLITAVKYVEGIAVLMLNGREIKFSDVLEIG